MQIDPDRGQKKMRANRTTWTVAVVMLTAVLCGYVGPATAVADDDGEVRIRLRDLRCYSNRTRSLGHYWLEADSRQRIDGPFVLVTVGQEPDSQTPSSLRSFSAPGLVPIAGNQDWHYGGQLESFRVGVAFVDEQRGEAATASADRDCEQLEGGGEFETYLAAHCARSLDTSDGIFSQGVYDLINNQDQLAFVQGSFKLLTRVRGGSFQQVQQRSLMDLLDARSVYHQADGYDQGRPEKVRAELEVELSGRDPIRKDAEADCPDVD